MRLAALDVGTNTVLMTVAERSPDGIVRPLTELSRITRLGRGVDRSGRLDPASAASTLDAIAEFVSRARTLGAERIVTAATSALRDAADGGSFIARVQARTGIALEVVSGEIEAQLSYLAAMRGLPIDPGQTLLIADIGGGSTELIVAEPGCEPALTSLQLGSVRLTERIVRHDPPSSDELLSLRESIDSAISQLSWSLHSDALVGIAGTVTTICAVAMRLEQYDSKIVHGHRLPIVGVIRVRELLASLPLDDRIKLPGMVAGRADVIVAGAIILERLMEAFGAREVIVSDQGVRWGLIWRELDRCGPL